jgi:hypothetical protein
VAPSFYRTSCREQEKRQVPNTLEPSFARPSPDEPITGVVLRSMLLSNTAQKDSPTSGDVSLEPENRDDVVMCA